MPEYTKKIVYLSNAQYQELITNKSVTVNGVTVNYDKNVIYMTPQNTPLYAEDLAEWAKASTKPTYTANEVGALPSNTHIPTTTAELTNDAGFITASDVAETQVQDVQVNGTSVLSNGVANVPMSHAGRYGVVKAANESEIKSGSANGITITTYNNHQASFYGLAKASGDITQSSSTNTVGTYTPEAKGAIQKMLGVSDLIAPEENNLVASQPYQIGDIFTANGKLYKATATIAADAAIIVEGANANAVETKLIDEEIKDVRINNNSILQDGIANIKIGAGLAISGTGAIQTGNAGDAAVKAGKDANTVIAPARQHMATFYGLSKVAGVDLADETVTLGTYPDNAKAAIRTMIGAAASGDGSAAPVQDVQVNGTSILSNKVANIPVATSGSIGAVRCGNGLYMGNNGGIHANFCSSDQIKTNASLLSTAIPPASLYKDMVFYGLAGVAGDTTQSASSNSIGTYTNEAKIAIQQMLGLDTITVSVTETAPTITAQSNHRYICGEVTSISFTPSASGLCELIFTSGSTVAVLTLPSTVKMPEWFEVEPERIYDIIITDGVYGAVTSWAM